MNYPEKVMRLRALARYINCTDEYLLQAFHTPGQTFAWQMNPLKRNSPILFDTEGFEKWRLKQVKLSQGAG